jgi:hypothetical protein
VDDILDECLNELKNDSNEPQPPKEIPDLDMEIAIEIGDITSFKYLVERRGFDKKYTTSLATHSNKQFGEDAINFLIKGNYITMKEFLDPSKSTKEKKTITQKISFFKQHAFKGFCFLALCSIIAGYFLYKDTIANTIYNLA